MSNGKGSKQRPAAVADDTIASNWDRTFGPRRSYSGALCARGNGWHRDVVEDPATKLLVCSLECTGEWECRVQRSHGLCHGIMACDEDSCNACGEDRPR